jgi:glycosyltransferase involved in cell wall biosynthesis
MRLLMFPHYRYPCSHAMLDCVYTHIFPLKGHIVQWIMETNGIKDGQTQTDWNGTKVTLIPHSGNGWMVSAFGYLNKLRFLFSFLNSLPEEGFDIVQVRNEMAASFFALWLRQRTGARFVFQISSPDAELRISMARDGLISPRMIHLVRGHLKITMRRWVCRHADAVLAISDAMRADMLRKDGLPAGKVVAFPLGFDDRMMPRENDLIDARNRYGIDERPLLIYFGSLAPVRHPDFLIPVLQRVCKEMADVRLLLVGEGNVSRDIDDLKDGFARAGLAGNVLFTGQISRRDVGALVCLSDASILPIRPIHEYVISSPTKLIESLGLGTSVIVNREIPEHVVVVNQSGGGVLVDYSPDAFASTAVDLLRSPQKRKTMGEKGRAWVNANRSYQILADQVEKMYLGLIQSNIPDGVGKNIRHPSDKQ